jgi:phosphohistidine phosphatase
MKTLYLLRHAKSSWSSPALPDFDRPLNDRGRRAASLMGATMRREGLIPELILCSTARRAVETLQRVAAAFVGVVPTRMMDALYLADAKSMLEVIRRTPAEIGAILIVGHNPGMQELALNLAGDGPERAVAGLAAKFPTGALAMFLLAASRWSDVTAGGARLERFVRPRDLAAGD